jgi:hypothetical protein
LFSLRHLPLSVLLISCSVYDESLLGDTREVDTGGALASSGRASTDDRGGRDASDGSGAARETSGAPAGGESLGGSGQAATAGVGSPMGGNAAVAGTGSGGSAANAGSGGAPDVPSGADLLDDMEDGNFYLVPRPPRFGYWYVAGDSTVGAQLPKIDQLVERLEPEREASRSAVHFTASGFEGWGASVGLSFADAAQKKVSYDSGNALGISFWIRGKVHDDAKLKVQLPVVGTDPAGTECGGKDQGQCLDHFAAQITVTAEWKQVTIPFGSLHQAGWGAPLAEFDGGHLLGIEWSAGTADLDVWIDDLALIRP